MVPAGSSWACFVGLWLPLLSLDTLIQSFMFTPAEGEGFQVLSKDLQQLWQPELCPWQPTPLAPDWACRAVSETCCCVPAPAGGASGNAPPADAGRCPGGDRTTRSSVLAENPVDRGAWRATVRGAAESDTTERLTLT